MAFAPDPGSRHLEMAINIFIFIFISTHRQEGVNKQFLQGEQWRCQRLPSISTFLALSNIAYMSGSHFRQICSDLGPVLQVRTRGRGTRWCRRGPRCRPGGGSSSPAPLTARSCPAGECWNCQKSLDSRVNKKQPQLIQHNVKWEIRCDDYDVLV